MNLKPPSVARIVLRFAVVLAAFMVSDSRAEARPAPGCSSAFGTVFDDKNSNGRKDRGEAGLAGVRVVSVEGLISYTDRHGRYSIPCPHNRFSRFGVRTIVKIDERTLPARYRGNKTNPHVIVGSGRGIFKQNIARQSNVSVKLDMDGDAFIAGSVQLKPAYRQQIQALHKQMRSHTQSVRKPMRVVVIYHYQRADYRVGRKRLAGLVQDLKKRVPGGKNSNISIVGKMKRGR